MNSEIQTSPLPEQVEPQPVETPSVEEAKKVPVPSKLQPFDLVLELEGEQLRDRVNATSATTALSQMVRNNIKRIPLKSEINGWAKSKKRIYHHGITRDYDSAKRKSFKNVRRQTYKMVDARPEGVPSFS